MKNKTIDYVQKLGAQIADFEPGTIDVENGPEESASELKRIILEVYYGFESVRLCPSLGEAALEAISVARQVTGRNKVLTFAGCYHGCKREDIGDVEEIAFNAPEALTEAMSSYGAELAAVIMEPIPAYMGLVLPRPGFLDMVRRLTKENGSLLIFDESSCGFRASLGGAQAAFAVKPDLTILGKLIGAGDDLAAIGGREELIELLQISEADVVATRAQNIVAGLDQLRILTSEPEPGEPDSSRILTIRTKKLVLGIAEKAKSAGIPLQVQQAGSMFCFFFSDREVIDNDSFGLCDEERYSLWQKYMAEQQIVLADAQRQTMYMSLAHTDEDVEKTIQAAEVAFAKLVC